MEQIMNRTANNEPQTTNHKRQTTNDKRLSLLTLFVAAVLVWSCGGNKNYGSAGGDYRNLFAEQGIDAPAIDARVSEFFQELFHGDSALAIYRTAGSNGNGSLAYIIDTNNEDIPGEGIAQGMMVCVQLDKKAEFDALWNWAYTYMYVTEEGHPNRGFFRWSVLPDGTPQAETPSPLAEQYFVTALYFAAHRWGNGNGIYEYSAHASRILGEIRHHPVTTGTTLYGERTLGPMVDEQSKLILFMPDGSDDKYTAPGYLIPGFYELWALWGPEEDRAFWSEAATASRRFLVKQSYPETGLTTDMANLDGTPRAIPWNPLSAHFGPESWRTLAHVGFDYGWWQKDKEQVALSNRVQAFLAAFGLDQYGYSFTRDGKVLKAAHRNGLAATAAVAGLAADQPVAADFVKALWESSLPEAAEYRSNDGMLQMLAMLQCSGKFRIWKP